MYQSQAARLVHSPRFSIILFCWAGIFPSLEHRHTSWLDYHCEWIHLEMAVLSQRLRNTSKCAASTAGVCLPACCQEKFQLLLLTLFIHIFSVLPPAFKNRQNGVLLMIFGLIAMLLQKIWKERIPHANNLSTDSSLLVSDEHANYYFSGKIQFSGK